MSANIWAPGSTPNVNANTLRMVEVFVATAGQTDFTLQTFTYSQGTQSIAVFKNGSIVAPSLVTEYASGDKITIAACNVSDVVVIEGFTGITGTASIPADGSITTPKLASTLVVPVNKGGTGAQDAATARTNLGITPTNIGALQGSDIGTSVQGYDVNTVKKNIANAFSAPQSPSTGSLTDAGTIAWDGTKQVVEVTLGGNRTLGAPTNVAVNTMYLVRVAQDATGGRTLSYDASYKFGSGGAPTITATANAVTWLMFAGRSSNTMEYLGSRLNAV